MVNFKEDINEAKGRLEAWWDHEIIDRPVFSYYASKNRASLGGYLDARSNEWTLAQQPENIKNVLDSFEKRAEGTYFGGESIPLLESVKLNQNNEWYDRLLRVTEYAAFEKFLVQNLPIIGAKVY
jgi:hypothetical protein